MSEQLQLLQREQLSVLRIFSVPRFILWLEILFLMFIAPSVCRPRDTHINKGTRVHKVSKFPNSFLQLKALPPSLVLLLQYSLKSLVATRGICASLACSMHLHTIFLINSTGVNIASQLLITILLDNRTHDHLLPHRSNIYRSRRVLP